MVNLCAGISEAEKARVLLPKLHQFVRSKVDMFCFVVSLAWVIDVFARQMKNKELDIKGEEAGQDAGKVLCCCWLWIDKYVEKEKCLGCTL